MAILLGQSGAGTNTANSASAGTGEATKYTALATGTVDTVQFFFASTNTAANVRFAIYADSAGSPGARIGTEQILASPTAGADNAITGFSAPVVLGTSYWIAWLLPNGSGGAFNYADFAASGGVTKDSTTLTLATLADPAPAYGNGPFANIVRVYATGTVGTAPTAVGDPVLWDEQSGPGGLYGPNAFMESIDLSTAPSIITVFPKLLPATGVG